jgi:hypothetical protein
MARPKFIPEPMTPEELLFEQPGRAISLLEIFDEIGEIKVWLNAIEAKLDLVLEQNGK